MDDKSKYVKREGCPLCNCRAPTKIDTNTLQCKRCHHIFRDYYVGKGVYKTYRSSAHHGKNLDAVLRWAKIRFKLLDAFGKKGSVLEIGCGHRYFLDELAKHGYTGEGTELSVPMTKEIPYQMYCCEPTEIVYIQDYDNICAFHVLEHMNDPLKEIKYLVSRMHDDGAVVFEIPTLVFNGLFIGGEDFSELKHTHFFNQLSLNIFVEKCGLKIALQTNYRNSDNGTTSLVCAVKRNRDAKKLMKQAEEYLKVIE